MSYNIYKGDELIATVNDKEYTVEGLEPNTEYPFSVSEVIGEQESEKATITVKTKPISVTGVTVAPKILESDAGKEDGANIIATVQPENATNKSVTYKVEPATEGLSVNASGRVEWTANVPKGDYTITATTIDGNKTDTCKLTLKEPVIAVTGVELTPNNMTGTQGTGANRQMTAKILPENASNKNVTYKVDEAEGLTVNASGVLAWTASTPAGTYTVTATTADGNKTDTSTLTINEPEPDPEPEE